MWTVNSPVTEVEPFLVTWMQLLAGGCVHEIVDFLLVEVERFEDLHESTDQIRTAQHISVRRALHYQLRD